jgi:hypothetical protein
MQRWGRELGAPWTRPWPTMGYEGHDRPVAMASHGPEHGDGGPVGRHGCIRVDAREESPCKQPAGGRGCTWHVPKGGGFAMARRAAVPGRSVRFVELHSASQWNHGAFRSGDAALARADENVAW